MFTSYLAFHAFAWLRRQWCQLRASQRARREMLQLAAMTDRELLDVGISRSTIATAMTVESGCH